MAVSRLQLRVQPVAAGAPAGRLDPERQRRYVEVAVAIIRRRQQSGQVERRGEGSA